MKKLIATAAAMAMFTAGAFADISFSSWGRANWITAANQTDGDLTDPSDEIVMGSAQSWGGASPRTGLSVHGSSDNLGFNLDIFGNGTDLSIGDNANIWWQPVSQVKVELGKVDNNWIRGNACYGLWDVLRIGAVYDEEGWTFQGQAATGAVIDIFPVEGLKIFASLQFPLNGAKSYEDVFTSSWTKYAAAYDINGVGTIKAGVTCEGEVINEDGDKKDNYLLNAAFDLSAVENLWLSVGAFIPTAGLNTTDYYKAAVNAFAAYTINDALKVNARVGTKIGTVDEKEESTDAFGFLVGGDVEYSFNDTLGLFVEADYANGVYNKKTSADNSDTLDIGVGLTKKYENGSVTVAFEGATNNSGTFTVSDADGFAWEIPVTVTISF